ncbi:MAG: molybdopterin-dependent oxidoreductase [Actinomycetota bacterium]
MVRRFNQTRRKSLTPSDHLRVGPFEEGSFKSALHSARTASILGIALGICFGIAFVTGVLSHLIQNPTSWFHWPSRPAGLFRITQGLHVSTGMMSIPLLLAKLWTVYPKLWKWPIFDDLTHLVERMSLFPLVAGSIFLLFTGLLNINYWYPWPFLFVPAHYWVAWITIGALIVHIGAKAATVRKALSSDTVLIDEVKDGLTRRRFLTLVGAASGVVMLSFAGSTVRFLRKVSVLAPRDPAVGPQGFPVNRSSAQARVAQFALDPNYRLEVEGKMKQVISLSLSNLKAMPQYGAELPIACVEGWSAMVRWRGVRLSDILKLVDAAPGASVRVESMERRGDYRTSILNSTHAMHPDTLLALEANGETLHLEHGFPVRLITPTNPGVMQTKWVGRLVVL